MESEGGDLAIAFKLAKDLRITVKDWANYWKEGAKDYKSQGDAEIAKEWAEDAKTLKGLKLFQLVPLLVKELKSYGKDAADVLAALIKSLNS